MRMALPEATGPLTVTVDSRLADDYLLVNPASVPGDPESSVCLAVSPDGTLLYHFAILAGSGASELQPSTTVAGGKIAVPLPGGSSATEIVGFVEGDGSVHACYATSGGMMHVSRDPAGEWPATAEPSTAQVTGLATTRNLWTQQTSVTAVTYQDGNLMLFAQQQDGSWQPNSVNVSGALGECQVMLGYSSPDDWTLFAASGSGPLQMWQGSGTTILSPAEPVTVAAPVAKVWFVHHQGASPTAIFSDVNGALYSSSRFADTVVKSVELSDVQHGSGMIGIDGYIQFFGADSDGTLWVLHQTRWDDSGAPRWAPIFQLDTDVNYVTAASGIVTPSATTMAIGAVGALATVDLITQPGADGLWNRAPVQLPPPESAPFPLQTNRYRTRLTIADANGLPCPGAQLTVTASELVGLEVAGSSVAASPGVPAVLTADPTGTIEFSQIATGLEAVTFSLTGPGIAAPVAVIPHQYLHEQLAGTASVFTGSDTIPPMSATTLHTATSAGNLVFPHINQAQADAVASANVAIFNVLNGTVPQGVTGYSLDLSSQQAPVFTPISSSGDLAAAKAALGQTAGGFWDDIGDFFGDVLHAIEQGALAVVNWTIDVVKKTISITVQISEEVTAVLADLALDTVSAAISLVHSLFNWLGAAVATVLDWLKDLLPWAQIWSTMETFDSYVIGSLDAVTSSLEHTAVVATGHFFADLKASVDNAFAQVIAGFGDQPLRPDYGSKPLSKPVTQPPGSLPGSSATNHWVKSKVLANVTSPGMTIDSAATPDLISQIIAAIQGSGIQADIAAEVTKVQDFFATRWGSADSVGQTPVASLLAVIQGLVDVVFDALDAMVPIVLELIGDVIGGIVTMLNTPLPDIPLLSWLWDHVLRPADSTDEMTMSKLICLAIAAPVVLISSLTPESSAETAADTMAGIRVITSAVLVLTDMTNDSVNGLAGEASMLTWLVNLFDVIANLIVQTLFWPIGTPMVNYPTDGSWDWSGMSLGDKATNGTWLGFYVPIVVDAAFTGFDLVAMKLNLGPSVTELTTAANIALDTVFGAGLMGGGIFGAWLQAEENPPAATWLDIFEAVVGPLPWATQPLIVQGLVEDSYGLSLLAQLVIDFLGDWDWSDYL